LHPCFVLSKNATTTYEGWSASKKVDEYSVIANPKLEADVFSSIMSDCDAAFLSPAKEVFPYCDNRQELGGPAELRSFLKSKRVGTQLDDDDDDDDDDGGGGGGPAADVPVGDATTDPAQLRRLNDGAVDADVWRDVCSFVSDIKTKDELRRSFVQTFVPAIEYDGLFGEYIQLNSAGDAKNYYRDWVRVLL
jgi:hypothetical protein